MRGNKLWIAATAASWAIMASGVLADETKMKSDQPVSDSYITTKVKGELAKDSTTKARHIHVTTKDGVVILKGNVGSDTEKAKAEQDASAIKGVVSVKNELMIKDQ